MAQVIEATEPAVSEHPNLRKWIKLTILVLIVVGLIVAVKILPVTQWLQAGLEWTDGLGIWGPVFVVGFYILACVLFLPGSIITLGAGFLFGVGIGFITVSIGSTLGACAAFLVGRTIARNWVTNKVAHNAKFTAIDEAVGRQGLKIVLLTRLSPVFPFNLLNYAFGLTKVSFGRYAFGSWLGMLPGTLMYVYIGAGLGALAEASGDRQKSLAEWIFFFAGLAVAVIVVVLVTRIARKSFRDAVPEKTKNFKTNPILL